MRSMNLVLLRSLLVVVAVTWVGRARADAALEVAVTHLAEGKSFDALVEGGDIRVGARHKSDLAALAAAPAAELARLVRHVSPLVRVAVATTIVASRSELLDALAPLYADDARVERQTFDVFRSQTVARIVTNLVCQRAAAPRFVEVLLAIARDEKATAVARSAALECAHQTQPEAARSLATSALSHTGDPLAAGAIRMLLTGWLSRQHLDMYALHNSQEPLAITWRPTFDELQPVARQASSSDRDVRELVGEAIAWVDVPQLRATVQALATDADSGVRMITLRSYMQRESYQPELLERCLADTNEIIADGCATMLAASNDRARWLAWAVATRRTAPKQAQRTYADLIRRLKGKVRAR